MKRIFTSALAMALCCYGMQALAQNPISFTNANSKVLKKTAFHSGVAVSVVDMDGDGMDDIARMNAGHDLYYEIQKTGAKFDSIHAVNTGSNSAWSMVVGDADNNGKRDVAVGFNGSAKLVKANSNLTAFTLTTLPKSNFFLQNMNFADIDQNGWLDIWGCNDNALSAMWGNDGTGSYPDTTQFFSPATTPASDNSGNYGTIWTDFDNDGDIDMYVAHCRQSVNSPTDPRRIDQLFVNDGTNHYYDDVNGVYGLRDGGQTWTASFEDIDNDGDLDLILTDYDVPARLLENDGAGHYTEITNGSGFSLDIMPIESKMEDFDNDGYVDILVTGDDARLFHNNHNRTFTLLSNVFDNNGMESFAVGDLNHDGRVDIYASYADIYTTPTTIDDVVWLNTSNPQNHFVTFNLQGTVSNRDALGARVEVYGAWGKQIREVRSGESYGTTNSFMCHFGLGSATTIDSAIIRWPSHIVTKLYNKPADQFITVVENQCSSPDNIISFNGPSVLCTGQSVTMQAPAGYTYQWSTGETTQSITVSTQGEFNVKITDNGCSSISKTVEILQSPDETPSITAVTPLNFCEGDSVILAGSTAASYSWSNGATTQNITVYQPGTYTLTIQGACAQFTSAPITIATYPSHVTNVTAGSACGSSAVTLSSTTSGTAHWFDAPVAGNEVGVGNSYTTAALNNSTTFYVESRDSILGISGSVGPATNSIGAGSMYTGDQAQIFDVLKTMVLKSVKVYSNSNKSRTIQLRNSMGTVLQQLVTTIDTGTRVVNLNWEVPVGTDYELGWLAGSQPDLFRNSAGANYPYTLNGLVSVTGNTANDPARWYCYYDWQVEEKPITCVSPRTPVQATINANPTVTSGGLGSQYYESDAAVTLSGTPTGGTFSGTGVSGSSFDPATAGVGGPYTVTYSYTDGNGCSGSATQTVTVLADTGSSIGIVNIKGISAVSVYPNPNSGKFELTFKSDIARSVDITITNAIGEKVTLERNVLVNNTFTKVIDLGKVATGVYTLTITDGKERASYKVVVQ